VFGVHQEWPCEELTEVVVLLTAVPNNKMIKIVQNLKPVLINLVCLYICTFSFFLIANDKHSGAWGSVVVKATSRTVPGSIPSGVTGDFFRGSF
jgi:hypothetical protein